MAASPPGLREVVSGARAAAELSPELTGAAAVWAMSPPARRASAVASGTAVGLAALPSSGPALCSMAAVLSLTWSRGAAAGAARVALHRHCSKHHTIHEPLLMYVKEINDMCADALVLSVLVVDPELVLSLFL